MSARPSATRRQRGHLAATMLAGLLAVALALPVGVQAENGVVVPVIDDFVILEDGPMLSGNVLANDLDPEGDTLVVTGHTSMPTGTLEIEPDGDFTFTPHANANGTETAYYSVTDGFHEPVTGLLTIGITMINDAPVATDGRAEGDEDPAAPISGSVAMLATDVEDHPLTFELLDATAHGDLLLLPDGGWVYAPDADWNGEDAFLYRAADYGKTSEPATVTITVNAVNDAPVTAPDERSTDEDTPLVIDPAGLVVNDTDVDDDVLAYDGHTQPAGAQVELVDGDLLLTPAANACGPDLYAFSYDVSDGTTTATGDVTVSVTCVADAPVAGADTVAATEDTTEAIPVADLLANDTDPEDGTLAITGITAASHGEAVLDGGTVTYTPVADACGDATFDYTVSDGGLSANATVTVEIECVNDGPVAGDDETTAVAGGQPVAVDVLADDTDADVGDTLVIASTGAVEPAGAGTASAVNGQLVFAAALGYAGTATVEYTVSDGDLSDTGTLTVTVVADTTAPAMTALTVGLGTGRVDETVPLAITWAAADADTGVASYSVRARVGTGAWSTIATGAGLSVTKLYPFGKVVEVQAMATDAAGNASGWRSLIRTAAAYQAPGSSAITYSAGWTTVSGSKHSGTGARYTATKRRWASFTTTGRELAYVAPRLSSGGYVKVYVDGTLRGRFNLASATTKYGQVIFRTQIGSGRHTIKIVSDSTKRAYLDAFVVLR